MRATISMIMQGDAIRPSPARWAFIQNRLRYPFRCMPVSLNFGSRLLSCEGTSSASVTASPASRVRRPLVKRLGYSRFVRLGCSDRASGRRDAKAVRDLRHGDVGISQHRLGSLDIVVRKFWRTTSGAARAPSSDEARLGALPDEAALEFRQRTKHEKPGRASATVVGGPSGGADAALRAVPSRITTRTLAVGGSGSVSTALEAARQRASTR